MYVFIAVTGRIILRTLALGEKKENEKKDKEKKGEAAGASSSKAGGPGSTKGKVEPKTPRVKGKVTADDDDQQAGDDKAGNEEEDDDVDMDDDIAALEAMEAEASTPGKKRGRPKVEPKSGKAGPKSGKKPKAKE